MILDPEAHFRWIAEQRRRRARLEDIARRNGCTVGEVITRQRQAEQNQREWMAILRDNPEAWPAALRR